MCVALASMWFWLRACAYMYVLQGLPSTLNNAQPSLPHYNYLVRIINPEQRSKFVAKIWHDVHEKFECASELKMKLVAGFEDKLPSLSDLECGYLHKSSKRWIENDQDLEAMYKLFDPGDEITVWCVGWLPEQQVGSGRKRKAEEPEPATKHAEKIDELAHELYEKHGEPYGLSYVSGPKWY